MDGFYKNIQIKCAKTGCPEAPPVQNRFAARTDHNPFAGYHGLTAEDCRRAPKKINKKKSNVTRGKSSRLSTRPTVNKPHSDDNTISETGSREKAFFRSPESEKSSIRLKKISPIQPCSKKRWTQRFFICQGRWLSAVKNQKSFPAEKSPFLIKLFLLHPATEHCQHQLSFRRNRSAATTKPGGAGREGVPSRAFTYRSGGWVP
jgi:hypothetical protein